MELGKHGRVCTMGRFEIIKEVQCGVGFKLHFKCSICERREVISSEKNASLDDVNNSFVWGALSIGIGYRQANDLLAVMDCPSPSFNKFKRHENLIGEVISIFLKRSVVLFIFTKNKYYIEYNQVWEQQLTSMLKKNGELEKEIAMQKGHLYKGTPYITVVGDGGWAKRSYGHGFNSQSGVVITK